MTVVLGAAFTMLASLSGDALLEARSGLKQLEVVEEHEELGELGRNVVLIFTVLALVATWRLRGPSPLRGDAPGAAKGGALNVVLAAATGLAAIGVLVAIFLAGHSGATAVWG